MNNLLFLFIFVFFSAPSFAGEHLSGAYQAKVIEIIDGDTFRASVKIWLGQEAQMLVRIDGIDTPELRGKCQQEKDKALKAKAQLQKLIGGKDIKLNNIHYGKYAGRVVARVTTDEGQDVTETFLAQNLAHAYQGKTRKSWC